MIRSPCLKKCKLDGDVCVSCKRTLEEIKNWRNMTEEERNVVMDRVSVIKWPDLHFPPINLLILHSAKWINYVNEEDF